MGWVTNGENDKLAEPEAVNLAAIVHPIMLLTLIAVLVVITLEFRWAESIRLRFAGYSSVNDWLLPSLVAVVLLTVAVGIVLMGACFIGGN